MKNLMIPICFGMFLGAALPVPAADALTTYTQLLQQHVTEAGVVNYIGLREQTPLLNALTGQLEEITAQQVQAMSEKEQIAFWLNAYNLLTLQTIVGQYPLPSLPRIKKDQPANSIMQIPDVWTKKIHSVAGAARSLDMIEHEILRKEFKYPMIHFGLVCASKGCAPLRNEAFVASQLDHQLSEQAKRYFTQKTNFRIEGDTVYLSRLFDWFKDDFLPVAKGGDYTVYPKEIRPVLEYISPFLSPEDSAALTRVKRATFLPYNWELNE